MFLEARDTPLIKVWALETEKGVDQVDHIGQKKNLVENRIHFISCFTLIVL